MQAVSHSPVVDMPLACRAVAIGASAGGIRALQTVLGALPSDFPVPVLVVLHLEPRHDSLLARVLRSPRSRTKPSCAVPCISPCPDRHLLAVHERVMLWNAAAEALYGIRREHAVGHPTRRHLVGILVSAADVTAQLRAAR